MDTGLWITWYDLPEDGRDAYLSWLHQTYIPGLLQRPGYLWAAHFATVDPSQRPTTAREGRLNRTQDPSVPTGDRYILLVGARNSIVFGDPVPSALHAELPDPGKQMLAMRIGERMNIMAELQRVEGPAAQDYRDGMVLAPCIQLGTYECPWQHEEEMLAWYTQWRMPAMSRLPGCIRTRRLGSLVGSAKHGVLYEFVSLEARNRNYTAHEDAHPEMKAWSNRIVTWLTHAPGSSYLACRIWPAVSN